MEKERVKRERERERVTDGKESSNERAVGDERSLEHDIKAMANAKWRTVSRHD
jgi:hypothetical protein